MQVKVTQMTKKAAQPRSANFADSYTERVEIVDDPKWTNNVPVRGGQSHSLPSRCKMERS